MELKNTTKKAQDMIDTYNHYLANYGTRESLRTIYSSYSWAKEIANENCLRLKDYLKGYAYCLLGHNSTQFSVGFKFMENDIEYLMYITKDNQYKIALS